LRLNQVILSTLFGFLAVRQIKFGFTKVKYIYFTSFFGGNLKKWGEKAQKMLLKH
jgi:hypothetical protein